MSEFISTNEQQTRDIAKQLASNLTGGGILLLHGDLGAGKTTFVKGLAEGLEVKDDILSPTFTLMNVYQITNQELRITNLVHVDTYRLKNEQELVDIGIEDYLGDPETICVIEWPEKVPNLLKNKKTVKVTIEHFAEEKRKITND